jgi:uncharacterized protein YfkK (UPF0435 family)
MVIALIVLPLLFAVLLPLYFVDFVTKFIAGFLGVLIGFSLDRQLELYRKSVSSKQIIRSFLTELEYNQAFCRKYKDRVVAPAHGNTVENFFDLFQISTWGMFCSRLEMENINVQYKIGEIYHKLQLFNAATVNNNEIQRTLGILLERDPKYLHDLEQELKDLVEALKNQAKAR